MIFVITIFWNSCVLSIFPSRVSSSYSSSWGLFYIFKSRWSTCQQFKTHGREMSSATIFFHGGKSGNVHALCGDQLSTGWLLGRLATRSFSHTQHLSDCLFFFGEEFFFFKKINQIDKVEEKRKTKKMKRRPSWWVYMSLIFLPVGRTRYEPSNCIVFRSGSGCPVASSSVVHSKERNQLMGDKRVGHHTRVKECGNSLSPA